jgi:hypothetical protein
LIGIPGVQALISLQMSTVSVEQTMMSLPQVSIAYPEVTETVLAHGLHLTSSPPTTP